MRFVDGFRFVGYALAIGFGLEGDVLGALALAAVTFGGAIAIRAASGGRSR